MSIGGEWRAVYVCIIYHTSHFFSCDLQFTNCFEGPSFVVHMLYSMRI